VKVLLDDRQHDELRLRAAAAGVSLPRLLTDGALDARQRSAAERRGTAAEFQRLARDLRAIADDLGRLGADATASGRVDAPPAAVDAWVAVTRLEGELTRAIRALAP
jgi:hypothetical protein